MTIKTKKRKHNRNNRNSDGLNSFKEISRDFRKKREKFPIRAVMGLIAGITGICKFIMRHVLPKYDDKNND